MGYKSDIEIAQEAKMEDIREVAKRVGLSEDDIELYGKYKAKVDYNVLKRTESKNIAAVFCILRPKTVTQHQRHEQRERL